MFVIEKLFKELKNLENTTQKYFLIIFENFLKNKLFSISNKFGKTSYLGKLEECSNVEMQSNLFKELETFFLERNFSHILSLDSNKKKLEIDSALDCLYKYYKLEASRLFHRILEEIVLSVDPNDEITCINSHSSKNEPLLTEKEQVKLSDWYNGLKANFGIAPQSDVSFEDLRNYWLYAAYKKIQADNNSPLNEKIYHRFLNNIKYNYFINFCFKETPVFLNKFVCEYRAKLVSRDLSSNDLAAEKPESVFTLHKLKQDLKRSQQEINPGDFYQNFVIKKCLDLMEIEFGATKGRSVLEFLKAIKINELLLCPISTETIQEPVLSPYGFTYERSFIENWLIHTKKCTDPMSRDFLVIYMLSSNEPFIRLQDLIKSHLLEEKEETHEACFKASFF